MQTDERTNGARFRLLIPASPTTAVSFEELAAGPTDDPDACARSADLADGRGSVAADAGPDRYWEFL
jgi:hypothetical protein